MVKKEAKGAILLSSLVILFILLNNYFPTISKFLNFFVFWICVLTLLYHIIMIILANIKSNKK